MAERKTPRNKEKGFIGVSLIKGNDPTLYNRFIKEVESDPELDQSKLVRLALKEYFDKRDGKE